MPFSNEDREQFAQLIGYPFSGWGELSYVSDKTYELAEYDKKEFDRTNKGFEQFIKDTINEKKKLSKYFEEGENGCLASQ